MRIGIATDHFYPELGGIQDSIAELSRELGARGHTVRIWAPAANNKDYAIAKLPIGEIDLGSNVTVHRIPAISFPSSSLQSRLAMPFCVPYRELAECDVIHTHSFLGIGLTVLKRARRLGIPIVGTNHWAIVEFSDYVHWLFEGMFRRGSIKYVTWYYNQCAHVTAPSQTVLTEKEVAGLRAKSTVVSNPIDLSAFREATSDERDQLRKEFGFKGPVIACVGRLAPEKKNDIVVRAFALVSKKVPDAILAFAGHGSFEPELRALAKDLGVVDRVHFLGTLTKQRVGDLYRASDVYAIASVSETQSMSLIQAFASGLPAVGVRWRAIPEYLNTERGFLFERDDYESMAKHLENLLHDDARRIQLGQNAHTFAQQFSLKAVVDQWEKIYSKTIDSK
jgi:1,2-diacylglycerol 3-alpha-glucosyltransferase